MGMKAKQLAARNRLPWWGVWPGWALANAMGGVVGWLIATLVGLFSLGFGLAGAGLIVGYCLGEAQKRFFERYGVASDRDWSQWVKYTTIGGTIASILTVSIRMLLVTLDGQFLLDPITPIIVFSISGAVFGLVQWLASRQHFPNTAWWVPVNAVGCCIGAFIGLRAGHAAHEAIVPGYQGSIVMAYPEGVHLFVAGAVGTAVFGIITGVGLIYQIGNAKKVC